MRKLLDWVLGRQSLRLASIGRFTDKIISIAWSPDGDMLAISPTTSPAGVYRLGSRTPIYEFETSDRCGLSQLYWSSRSGLIAAGGLDASVRIWNGDGKCTDVVRAGGTPAEALGWNESGRMLAICSRKRLRLWNHERRCIQEEYAVPGGSSGGVCWHGDGELFIGTSEGAMVWLPGERRLERQSMERASVRSVSMSTQGRFLTIVDAGPTLILREVATGIEALTSGQGGDARSLSWSGDGRYLAVRTRVGVTVYDWSGFPGSTQFSPHITALAVSAIAFQNAGNLLAIGLSTKQIGLFDPVKEDKHMIISDVDASINILRWSPDDRQLAVGCDDGSVLLYELR